MKAHELKTTCPSCHVVHTHAGSIATRNAPKPGDYNLCVTCHEISCYDDDLQLRALDAGDAVDLPAEDIALMQRMLREGFDPNKACNEH